MQPSRIIDVTARPVPIVPMPVLNAAPPPAAAQPANDDQSHLLARLSPQAFAELQRALCPEQLAAGELVLEAASAGDAVLVVLEGRVLLEHGEPDEEQAASALRLEGGGLFAAHTFGDAAAWRLTASAPVRLLRLSLASSNVSHETRSLLCSVSSAARQALALDLLRLGAEPVATCQLLAALQLELSPRGALALGSVAAGPERLLLVEAGSVAYGARVCLAGDVVGLEAVLLGVSPPEARALSRCVLSSLPAWQLGALLQRQPSLGRALAQLTVQRGAASSGRPALCLAAQQLFQPDPSGPPARSPYSLPGSPRQPSALARQPFERQRSDMDCGVACLRLIASHHGQQLDYDKLRAKLRVVRYGTTLVDLADCAEYLGFAAHALQLTFDKLRQIDLPAIAHLEKAGHYVVLWRASKKHVWVSDPGFGKKKLRREAFSQDWAGTLLIVLPTDRSAELCAPLRPTSRSSRPILPLLRGLWGTLSQVLLASVVLQLLALVAPLASQLVIDRALPLGDHDLLLVCFLGLLGASVLGVGLSYARSYLLFRGSAKFEKDLLESLYRRVLGAASSMFDRFAVTDVLNRFGEVALIRNFVVDNFASLCVDGFGLLTYGSVLLFLSPQLALIVLGSLPLSLLISVATGRLMRAHSFAQREHQDRYQNHLLDVFKGFESVKYLSLARPFTRWMTERLAPVVEHGFLTTLWSLKGSGGLELVQAVTASTVLFLGGRAVLSGEMTPGQFVAFSMLAGQVTTPLLRVMSSFRQFQRAEVSIYRVRELLDQPADHDSEARGILWLPQVHGHIRFENVSLHYSGPESRPALADVDFAIRPGEVIGVVGRSGSGKSSLIKLLLGLKRPDRGAVFLDGYDTRDLIPESVRRQVGVVTQDAHLISGTIFDNIACGRLIAKEAVWAAARLAGAYEFISELPNGFQTPVGERGVGLSGGQRQRLVIARALVRNPGVLVFDEATASLDAISEQEIHEQLAQLAQGRTTLIVSHRIATLRHVDRLLVLDGGRVVEFGSHEELVARRGLYWQLAHASPEWPSKGGEAA